MITSITQNTTALTNTKRFCIAIRGLTFPEMNYTKVKRGGFSGQKISPSKPNSFKFSSEWMIIGSSFSDLATQREDFIELLGDILKNESATWKINKANAVNVQVEVKGVNVTGDVQADDGSGSKMLVELLAEYPYLVSQSETSQDVFIFNGGGMSIPMRIPMSMAVGGANDVTLTNNGNADAYPVLTFYGPLTNPSVANITTNKTLSLNLTLNTSNDYVVVDTFLRTAVLYPSGSNARQYISGDFWTLDRGNNIIHLGNATYNNQGKCNVSFRDHYLGV